MLLGVNEILYLCTYIISRISAFSYERVTHDRCDTCFYKIPTRGQESIMFIYIYIIILYILYKK